MDAKYQALDNALIDLVTACSEWEDERNGPSGAHPAILAADRLRDAGRAVGDRLEGVHAEVIVYVFTFEDGHTERVIHLADMGLIKATERAIAHAALRESDHGAVTYWAHAPGVVVW
jgi:hypothetical protein